jgi:hypothetical protein
MAPEDWTRNKILQSQYSEGISYFLGTATFLLGLTIAQAPNLVINSGNLYGIGFLLGAAGLSEIYRPNTTAAFGYAIGLIGTIMLLSYPDIGVVLCIAGFSITLKALKRLLFMISRSEFEIWGQE